MFLRLFIFSSFHVFSEASLADGWGGPALSTDHEGHSSEKDTVAPTATGAAPAVLMRREESQSWLPHFDSLLALFHALFHHSEEHTFNGQTSSAMFQSIDLNNDGKITKEEIASFNKQAVATLEGKKHFHIPNVDIFIAGVDKDGDGHISVEEFDDAIATHGHHKAKTARAHRRHTQHSHLAIDDLDSQAGAEDVVLAQASEKLLRNTDKISCGGHEAVNCSMCPADSANGGGCTSSEAGTSPEACCNGVCGWCRSNSSCVPTATATDNACLAGDLVANAAVQPGINMTASQWTANDDSVAEMAAEAAINEENEESQAMEREQNKAKEKKSMAKFWLYTIIIFSIILGACAIVSAVAFIVFCVMGVPGPAPQKFEDENDEGEGEDQGEDQ